MKKFILIIAICAISPQSHSQSWNLAGNAGTSSLTDFIGTTDNTAVKIKVNNNASMFFGTNSFVAIGDFSPNYKLDVGGDINTNSKYRINGLTALSTNGSNIFVGNNSGTSITTGTNNTGTGGGTLNFCTSCSNNTAGGINVLRNTTTGRYNTGIGAYAIYTNTTGEGNTGMGYYALYNNNGSYNTAVGEVALLQNLNGTQNTAVGCQALYNNVNNYNTGVGFGALYSTASSQYNTAIGWGAGNTYNHGWFNTFIGAGCDANQNSLANSIALGEAATVTASNQTRIGNSVVTSTGAYTGWTNISDGRYKKNVKEDVKGMDFIMKLRPVTYNLDVSGISNKLNESRGKEMSEQMKNAISEKEKIIYSGFVAQEVEQSAKELGYDFSGVDKPKNENDMYGLRYAEFVVPLVKGMQEQQQMIDELKRSNDELKKQNENLKNDIAEIKIASGLQTKKSKTISSVLNNEFQIFPNPATESISIHFENPSSKEMQLIIFDAQGKTVKSVLVNGSETQINISEFANGNYFVQLLDGDILLSGQKMTVIK
ncbi:MAG TPA: T9SS type A sorting domain-containing protein [Bacteroidia bacterium]|nr:T9SS type A sorting domain-containing protein [Bacteroidia bacterium]